MLEQLIPNIAILKHPGNWVFVLFVMLLVFAVLYFVTPDMTGDQ